MRIQHNIMAMNAYRNYNNNTSALSRNLEKLSSGYKINRAGDDAAGLAISEKMRAQITGLDAAQKNVKDGISLVKTAEGAMQEVQDMLNRMVYLATQSANGTYDNEVDRANLQKEVDQLKSEINRIADSANFNGIKLLDGSLEAKTETINAQDLFAASAVKVQNDGRLAVDPQAGVYTIDFSQLKFTNTHTSSAATLAKMSIGDLAVTSLGLSVAAGSTIDGADVVAKLVAKYAASGATINGNAFSLTDEGEGILKLTMKKAPTKAFASVDIDVAISSVANLDGNYGNQFALTEITAAVPTTGRIYANATLDLTAGQLQDGAALKIGDTTYTFAVGKDSKFKGLANVIDLTDKTGEEADFVNDALGRLTTAAQNNKQFLVGHTFLNGTGTLTFTEKEGGIDYAVNNLAGTSATNTTDGDWTGLITLGQVDAAKMQSGLTLQIGDTSEHYNQLKVNIKDMHVTALGLDSVNIGTIDGAAAAINTIKTAINTVSSVRGDLGATQNRLEHTANNLSVMEENIQDAESTIRDTDIAEEMMAYTKNNILVQSAQAMLAQANMVPQGVLQLLG